MRYVIERQYLMPVYQRLVVEADNIEDACQQAVEHDDWQSAEDDTEGSGSTTINAIKEIPEGVGYDVTQEVIGPEERTLGEYLWEDPPGYPKRLPVPHEHKTLQDF